MEILHHIPVSLNIEEIKRQLHIDKRREWWNQVQNLVETAKPLIFAQAVYKVCYIEARFEDTIRIDGIQFTSKLLRHNLGKVGRVFPYAVTIGDKIEDKIRTCKDQLKKYFLDTIANIALSEAGKYLEDKLRFGYALDGLSSMIPGSLKDWPIEEQRKLFSILGDVEDSIGVRLTENFLMIPVKSLSGICFPTEIPFYSCQLCPRKNCPSRKAVCNEKLSREYGIVN